MLVELFLGEPPSPVSSFANFPSRLQIISYACVPALLIWADTPMARFGVGIQSLLAVRGTLRGRKRNY